MARNAASANNKGFLVADNIFIVIIFLIIL